MESCEGRGRRSPFAVRTLMRADVYELARRGLAEYESDGAVGDATWEAFIEAGLDADIPAVVNSAVGRIRLAGRELRDGEDDRAVLRAYVEAGAAAEGYEEAMARCRRIGDPDFVARLLRPQPNGENYGSR